MFLLENTGIAYVFNAPCDVILNDQTVVQPDLAIERTSRKSIVSARGIEGPPDLAIEILSPSTRATDEKIKLKAFARFGVPR